MNQREDRAYRSRIRAWTMYDWANSAFATTILAAVLPVYYSQVAGASLPSPAVATAYWSTGLSLSVVLVAILSPILGTVSDIVRGKKAFLAGFTGLGVLATGLLVLVKSGDWLLASLLFVLGRVGFSSANVFYDSLLPHVARPDDQDRVSARGFALGYLGGGILLAVNVVMIQLLPGTWGPRLSFLSVALWWALFSIPILTRVPEPQTLTARLQAGQTVLGVSFRRLADTLKDLRQYRELFRFLLAYLIYIDGVGTIIGVAAIYGAELGFGTLELILALLLVQFVGIPFSLIFGRLPTRTGRYRPLFLAFILANLLLLPALGLVGRFLLPGTVSGAPLPPYQTTATALGQGEYNATNALVRTSGDWERDTVPAERIRTAADRVYLTTSQPGARVELPFHGQRLTVTYGTGPDHGRLQVLMDGAPLLDRDGAPVTVDQYSPTRRYEVTTTIFAPEPGVHLLALVNAAAPDPRSSGTLVSLAEVHVLPPLRTASLPVIIAAIVALEAVCFLLALLLGRPLFSRLAEAMTTKRSLILALAVYAVITIWGFFLDSVVEFWSLAWLVACVQGGSQALSRSLYASMVPAVKSGEFFGFFGIMEKFAAIFGPLVFAGAGALFGSSRPAVLGLILFFLVGTYLLARVDVEEGRRVAREENSRLEERPE